MRQYALRNFVATLFTKVALSPFISMISASVTAIWREWDETTWVFMGTTILSGLIGFGTGAKIYSSIPHDSTPHVRYRSGPNVKKQWLRQISAYQSQNHNKRRFSPRKVFVAKAWLRFFGATTKHLLQKTPMKSQISVLLTSQTG